MRKILLYILALALASCSPTSSVELTLDSAESVMEAHPDSALSLLESIRKDDLRSERLRALYGLLMTQALDKNYVDVTSDSLIQPAVDYYSNSSDKMRQMKSLYYLAGVDYYRKDYPESLIASLKAYELACELDDKFWIGQTARRIYTIYHDNFCAKEERQFAQIALDNFRQTDRKNFIYYGIYDLACAYHSNEDYATARRISMELLDTAEVYGDYELKRQALELIGLGYMARDSNSMALKYYREIIALPTAYVTDSAFYNGLCLNLRRPNEIVGNIQQLVNSKNIPDYLKHWLKWQWYQAQDSTHQTIKMIKAITADTDKALKESRRQNLAGSLMDYHRYQDSMRQARLRIAHIYTAAVIIAALIIIISVCIFARRRHLRQQMLIDEYMTMANELRILISENTFNTCNPDIAKDSGGEYAESLTNDKQPSLILLEKYFSEFDTLCKSFRREPTADARNRISESVGNLIDSFGTDNIRLQELENYVNYRYDNVMAKLRTDFPNLKDIDYMIFLLSRLGFSIPTVTLILKQENKTVIYNRRKRLKEKFRIYDGPNREMYLDVMP